MQDDDLTIRERIIMDCFRYKLFYSLYNLYMKDITKTKDSCIEAFIKALINSSDESVGRLDNRKYYFSIFMNQIYNTRNAKKAKNYTKIEQWKTCLVLSKQLKKLSNLREKHLINEILEETKRKIREN